MTIVIMRYNRMNYSAVSPQSHFVLARLYLITLLKWRTV